MQCAIKQPHPGQQAKPARKVVLTLRVRNPRHRHAQKQRGRASPISQSICFPACTPPNASTPPAPKPAPRRTNRHPTLPPVWKTHAPPHRRKNPTPILGLPRLPQRQRQPRHRSLGPRPTRRPRPRLPTTDPSEKSAPSAAPHPQSRLLQATHPTRPKSPARQTHPHLRGTFFTPLSDPPKKPPRWKQCFSHKDTLAIPSFTFIISNSKTLNALTNLTRK
jgi:hypothetical protein